MSFDAIAPWYRTLETLTFGNALQRARVACLDEIGSPRRALIVGEGNGRFLGELLRRQPKIEVDCVDSSQQMLDLARRRVMQQNPDRISRVAFLHRDITSWAPDQLYDLIVTHFVLDCFDAKQVAEIVAKLAQVATDDAIWLLADFRMPSAGFARIRARGCLAVMYRFFRAVAGIESQRLVDPSPFVSAQGFILTRQHLIRSGILKSELWRRQL